MEQKKINLTKKTLADVLKNSVEKYPNNPCIGYANQASISYIEFSERVQRISEFLKEEGIISGDKVAILSENQPNWAITYFAVTTMGAVLIPIMTEFHSSQVQHILNHSEAKAVFISAKFLDKLESFKGEHLRIRIRLDDFSVMVNPDDDEFMGITKPDFLKKIIADGVKEFAKFKESAMKFVGMLPESVEENSIAQIIYTSGTTGHSKGVILTHKNIVSNAISTHGFIDMHSEDRMLSILPLFHTMESTLGLVLPLMLGVSVSYLEKPPTAAVLLPALSVVKPTVMLAVPLIIEKIFKSKIYPELNKKFIVKSLYKIPTFRKKFHKIAGQKLLKTFGGELKMFCIGGASLASDVERFLKEGGLSLCNRIWFNRDISFKYRNGS